jgi:hypothetical protein
MQVWVVGGGHPHGHIYHQFTHGLGQKAYALKLNIFFNVSCACRFITLQDAKVQS